MSLLVIPNVLPAEFCAELVQLHRAGEPRDSGFVWPENGVPVEQVRPEKKRRRDLILEGQHLQASVSLLRENLVPFIAASLGAEITSAEPPFVGAYHAEESGHYTWHIDNFFPGTRHRHFALTIALTDDHEGGDLETGGCLLRPDAGTAVVFPCSQLHRVRPVTKGSRYVLLSFLTEGRRL